MGDRMEKRRLDDYMGYLVQEEKSIATRQQYERDIRYFMEYLEDREVTKEAVIEYKEELCAKYQPASVNTKLAAVNGFFQYLGWGDLKVKQLKIQRRPYCTEEKELTKKEYLSLIQTAKKSKNQKLSYLIQTICGTGIRVSELRFITAEAVRAGEAVIRLKGKTRIILIGGKLQKELRRYMKKEEIQKGPVFVTRTGECIDRSNIWKMMKGLCKEARVCPRKVFPHNLRHLFARTFYKAEKDLAKLADILGHSNINTTRIYIISTGREHERCINALGLVV